MISLRCATQPSPLPNGVASFHFGNSHGSVSTIGRNLADFIQREVVARTGLQDCRTHGRTWDLLRLTRMPTVQVDIGYITNPRDRAMLVTTQTRDSIAEGILAAVKRLYLLGKNDRPTGTFTFAELLAHELSVEQAGRLSRSVAPRPAPAPTGSQLRALQQPIERGLHFGLPAQALVQLEAQPREVPVRRDNGEADVQQEIRSDHALVERAVAERLYHRADVRRSGAMVYQLLGLCGPPERLQRADSASDQIRDRLRDEAAGQGVGLPGLDAHRRQEHRVGADGRGGKRAGARNCARRRV